MTELQIKVLEKIEELTLHTLEKGERLQVQGEKLREMEALNQKNTRLEARLSAVDEILSDR